MITETLFPSPRALPPSLEALKAAGRVALAERAAHEGERLEREAVASQAALYLTIAADLPRELLSAASVDLEHGSILDVEAATQHFVLTIALPDHAPIYAEWLRAGPTWTRRELARTALDAPGVALWRTGIHTQQYTRTLGAALALAEEGQDEGSPFPGEVR